MFVNFPWRSWSLLSACLVVPVGLASAALYKWTDENGIVVYSQTPPPSGQAKVIRTAPGPDLEQRRQAAEALRSTVEQTQDAATARAQAREEKKQQQAQDNALQTRAKSCEIARKNLATLENLGLGRLRMPDGQTVFLSAEERAARMQETRTQIEQFCD